MRIKSKIWSQYFINLCVNYSGLSRRDLFAGIFTLTPKHEKSHESKFFHNEYSESPLGHMIIVSHDLCDDLMTFTRSFQGWPLKLDSLKFTIQYGLYCIDYTLWSVGAKFRPATSKSIKIWKPRSQWHTKQCKNEVVIGPLHPKTKDDQR